MLPAMLFAVSLLTFCVAWNVPPQRRAMAAVDKKITDERLQQIIDEHGWNDPFLVQYGRYLGDLLHGRLGRSIDRNTWVSEDLRAKVPATVELALASMLFAATGGIALGL